MSDQNKQKRRYSCQSWNVAAKVVLTPEVFDYDSDEDFVTACDSQRVAEEDEITENLQTCFEDLSENTQSETLTPGHVNSSHHESNSCKETLHNDNTLNGNQNDTGKDILRMCAKAQDKLRKSILLENLPSKVENNEDIENIKELIFENENVDNFHHSKSNRPDSDIELNKTSKNYQVSREKNTIQVPNWDNMISETSQICDEKTEMSTETLVCSSSNSETINANSSETFIVNEISKFNSSSITEKVDEKSKVSASNTFICHENVQSQNCKKKQEFASTETLCIDDTLSETVIDVASVMSTTLVNEENQKRKNKIFSSANEEVKMQDSISSDISEELSSPTLSRESSVSFNSQRSNSHLFNKIKERYEKSVTDSESLQISHSHKSQPKRVLKDINFKNQPIHKYQNIPYTPVQNHPNHSKIKNKLDELQRTFKEDPKKQKDLGYSKPHMVKSFTNSDPKVTNNLHEQEKVKNGLSNELIVEEYEKNEAVENDDIKFKSIIKTQQFDQSLDCEQKQYVETREEKEYKTIENQVNSSKEIDPHIYEEVGQPPTEHDIDRPNEYGSDLLMSTSHVYDELKKPSKGTLFNKLIVDFCVTYSILIFRLD